MAAAELLDDLEAIAPDDHSEGTIESVQVEEVITVVELTVKLVDGEEYCQVRTKCSHESPVYKKGLLEAGRELITYDDD